MKRHHCTTRSSLQSGLARLLSAFAISALALLVACAATSTDGQTRESRIVDSRWSMSDASFAIPDNVIPTLEFRAGRLLAHSGCNRASGSFRDLGGRLEVTALLATKVGCREPLNQFEIAYYRLLEATPAYRIDQGALVLTAGADRARFTRAADSGAR